MPRLGVLLPSAVLTVAVLVAGGPSWSDEAKPAKSESKPYPEGINCVWAPNLRSQSFYVIDDQHLVIELPFKKRYLLTLTRRCWDLDTVEVLRLASHGDQICGPGDSVVTSRDRCMIAYLEEVPSYKDGKAIVAAREAAKKAARKAE
jgi:Family of unknown function (DUF6491)